MKTQLLKSISSLLFLAFATSTSVAQTAEKPNGSGTESDPYAIATLNNLYWLTEPSGQDESTHTAKWDHWDKHFRQTADIDVSGTQELFSGVGLSHIGRSISDPFSGSYDGQGFRIDGLTYDSEGTNNGFFGVTSGATIRNLGLTNVDIHGYKNVGALVGNNIGSTIINCYSTGKISGERMVGGLVGTNQEYLDEDGNYQHSYINYSYSTCSVEAYHGDKVGGLVGHNKGGHINYSYSRGDVWGGTAVGGLVGFHEKANLVSFILDSYSTSKVTGYTEANDVGGLVGDILESTAQASFWDIESSSQATSAVGDGKTTLEMKKMGTFTSAGWDFESETGNGIENVWDMDMSGVMNDGYPYLWYQDGDATSLDVSDAPVLPDGFAIHQNYPNPFNPTTTISYDLPKRSQVTLGIYDLLGKQIKTLVNQSQDAGNKIAVWDGTNNLGRQVSAGVYLYQIQAGEFTQTRKMLFLK